MLALALSVLNAIALRDVPQWGRSAEHAWEGDVHGAMAGLVAASSRGVGQDSTVTATLPTATDPQTMDVPLFGTLAPLPPTSAVSLDPDCARFDANHTTTQGGVATTWSDLLGAAKGCLVFEGQTSYARPFRYVFELGGLLRVQGGNATVISGPARFVNESTPLKEQYRISITMTNLTGPALSAADTDGVRVDLAPGLSTLDEPVAENADDATWVIHSDWAAAWREWYRRELTSEFAPGTYSIGAVDAGCTPTAASHCVVIKVDGPSGAADLSLVLAHGVYDVSLR